LLPYNRRNCITSIQAIYQTGDIPATGKENVTKLLDIYSKDTYNKYMIRKDAMAVRERLTELHERITSKSDTKQGQIAFDFSREEHKPKNNRKVSPN
jgi:hypothetical protein